MEHCDLLVVQLAMLVEVVVKSELPIFLLQFLINQRQVQYILRGIVDHVLSERPLLPEHIVVSHLLGDLMLLSMCHIYVSLQQIGQRDVVVFVVDELLAAV